MCADLFSQYDAAKGAYKRVLDRDPNHPKVLQHLGILYHCQSSNPDAQEQAIDYLERSLRIDPDNAQSWYLLGRSYITHSNFPKAYEAYQQAVFRDANNPKFWCSIGVLYYKINQYHDALDAYARSLHIDPYISEAWFNLGTLYESCNNQVNDALDAYFRATELDPNNQQIKARVHILQTCQAKGVTTTIPPPPPQDVQLHDFRPTDDSAVSPHSHAQPTVKHEVAPPRMTSMPHMSQPPTVSPQVPFTSQSQPPPPPSLIAQHPPPKIEAQPPVQRISEWPRHPDLHQPLATIPSSTQAPPQPVHLYDPRATHSLPPPPHPVTHIADAQPTYSSVPVSPRSQVPPPSMLAGPPNLPPARKTYESLMATPVVSNATLPSFNSAFMRREAEWPRNAPPQQKVSKPSGSMRRGSFTKEGKERKEQARQEKARAKEAKEVKKEKAKEEKARSKKASQEASQKRSDKDHWPRESQAEFPQQGRVRRDIEEESHPEKLRSVSPASQLPPQPRHATPPAPTLYPHASEESQQLQASAGRPRDRTESVSVKRRHEPESSLDTTDAAPPPAKRTAVSEQPPEKNAEPARVESDKSRETQSNVTMNRTEGSHNREVAPTPVSNSTRKENEPERNGDGTKKVPPGSSGRRDSMIEPRPQKSWLETAVSSKSTDRQIKHDKAPISPPSQEQETLNEEPIERPAREMNVDEDYDFEGDTDGDEQMKEATPAKVTDVGREQSERSESSRYHRHSLPSPASRAPSRERQPKDADINNKEEPSQTDGARNHGHANDEDTHMKGMESDMPTSPAASTTATSVLATPKQDYGVDKDGDATMRKSSGRLEAEPQEQQQQQQPQQQSRNDAEDMKMKDVPTEPSQGDNMTATTATTTAVHGEDENKAGKEE